MKKIWTSLATLFFVSTLQAADNKTAVDRVENSGKVLAEILSVPEDIPQGLLDKASCVVVLPSVVKAAFVVGANYGRGVMTCRSGEKFNGKWGSPTMMALEGGSFGLQIGGQATDFVLLLVMSMSSCKPPLIDRLTVRPSVRAGIDPSSVRMDLLVRKTRAA